MKLNATIKFVTEFFGVATAPTVHGIETDPELICTYHLDFVATAPTVHGIETLPVFKEDFKNILCVATAPTVHGIETQIFPQC